MTIKTIFVLAGKVVSAVTHDNGGVVPVSPDPAAVQVDLDGSSLVDVGWAAVETAGAWTFTAPAPKPPSVTSTVFYDLFTITEMIDIEANKGSNPVVGQFYKRWQNAQADGTMIDLGTDSVVKGLAYLSVTQVPVTAPTPAHTYIDPARIPVIQSGIPQ